MNAMKILTRSLVRHAHAIAREVSARVVLLSADVVEEDAELASLIQDVDFRVVLVTKRPSFQPPEGWHELCATVRIPDLPMTRAGQIKIATLIAAVEGLIHVGDRILWLTGTDGSNTIDALNVLDLNREFEMFSVPFETLVPVDVKPAVFERVLSLAGELGLEGREGRPVGTIFILGDTDRVLGLSRQLVINPFQGYPEAERNVLDPRLEETLKEFSAIDGAFVVRGDGVVLCSGRYLVPQGAPHETLPQGLGTRHEAAAGITGCTDALALCISQSTGTVSIFKSGRLVADIQKPRSRGSDGGS
jgi:DNA integrity scanning protein DisA with diadenylate cyclase activity